MTRHLSSAHQYLCLLWQEHYLPIQVTGANGVATNYTFPVNGPNFSDVFPAPGAPGAYTVTSTFTPSAGSTLTGSTSGPASLTVAAAAATITETVNPNPATAGSTVTVNGTVTNADGSAGAGTVQLYVRRNTLYDYVAKYAGRWSICADWRLYIWTVLPAAGSQEDMSV